MQRDAQQSAFRRVVHAEVERSGDDHAIDHALHSTGILFQDQQIGHPEKRDADRCSQLVHDGSDAQGWVEQFGGDLLGLCRFVNCAVAAPRSTAAQQTRLSQNPLFISSPSWRNSRRCKNGSAIGLREDRRPIYGNLVLHCRSIHQPQRGRKSVRMSSAGAG
jgi:hypothetical protein